LLDERPCLIFQGDLFEYDANFIRIKNLLAGYNTDSHKSLDFFVENIKPGKINIREGLRHFIVITAHSDNKLALRQYELSVKPFEVINASTDLVYKNKIH
jgi:hypothetical protein